VTRQVLRRAAARLGERLIDGSLTGDLRRVVWVGDAPERVIGTSAPVVLYANHHYFHDSYLLWHLVRRVLDRRFLVWMEKWEQAPLFGPLGALPFPSSDPRARAATLRYTARRMKRDPNTTLVLYPEARLSSPDAGLQPFSPDLLSRLARVFPEEARWCPVGVRMTWWGEERPTALLAAGPAHAQPDGDESDRLHALLQRLRSVQPDRGEDGGLVLPPHSSVLLEGERADSERWDLSRLAPFYRWLAR
jgi:hypothetical protein